MWPKIVEWAGRIAGRCTFGQEMTSHLLPGMSRLGKRLSKTRGIGKVRPPPLGLQDLGILLSLGRIQGNQDANKDRFEGLVKTVNKMDERLRGVEKKAAALRRPPIAGKTPPLFASALVNPDYFRLVQHVGAGAGFDLGALGALRQVELPDVEGQDLEVVMVLAVPAGRAGAPRGPARTRRSRRRIRAPGCRRVRGCGGRPHR